ncbi:hypothetical protein [Streptomyces capitiformicae]|nr:hypothetical protein [Streptomyces capitiformicae]
MIAGILGAPAKDLDFFSSTCAPIASTVDSREEIGAAYAAMSAYLDRLITAKEEEPGEDLLGRVIRRHLTAGTLDHSELVAVAQLLIAAGPRYDVEHDRPCLHDASAPRSPADAAEIGFRDDSFVHGLLTLLVAR